jgi:hypothetical protein
MKQLFLFFVFLLPLCTSAQITESFNQTTITANYPWAGDLDKFKTADGFLQLNDMKKPSEAKLYLYGATLASNTWEFRVKSDYGVSNYNLFRIYLWSNSTDLDSELSAYYLEIGKNQKRISLYQATEGMNPTALIQKEVGALNKAFDLHIKIVADEVQTLTVYARADEDPTYSVIGSAKYTPQTTQGYFILYCKYSTEHAQDKYFGPISIQDFSIGTSEEGQDNGGDSEGTENPLTIESISQIDTATLEVSFNRAVIPAFASFTLSSLGEVSKIYLMEKDEMLQLEWAQSLKNEERYTLSFSELYDKSYQAYSGSSQPFIASFESKTPEVTQPETASYTSGDIRINEVMANPKGVPGLPETEYVELWNTTHQDIPLSDWFFVYDSKAKALESVIPAQGYAVLYRSGREILIDSGGVSIPLATFPSALANTGKELQLRYQETVIDQIAYPEAEAGYSWERVGDTWKRSSDARGGTPGSVNSPQDSGNTPSPEEPQTLILPGQVVFSELLPEPQSGGSEYIELYNRSEEELPIASLSIATRKSDGSLSTHYPLSSITTSLQPGAYTLLTKNREGVADFFLIQQPDALQELKLPVLSNVSAQLVLFRSDDEEVIDEVHYSYKWHSASLKDPKGVSLERIHLDGESQDPDNWTSASTLSGGGTPGYKNSQAGLSDEGTSTEIEAPEYNATTGYYEIRYQTEKAGYYGRAEVFDSSGRRVATIMNHALLGTSGTITWEGVGAGNSKLATGVYILTAELYHPEGDRKHYKQVFLVR